MRFLTQWNCASRLIPVAIVNKENVVLLFIMVSFAVGFGIGIIGELIGVPWWLSVIVAGTIGFFIPELIA